MTAERNAQKAARNLKNNSSKKKKHFIQMKATEQYFPVTLFIMLHMVGQTFESVDKIL